MTSLILVCIERRDPKLCYGTNYMYLGGFICKFTGGGNPPLGRCVTKKGLVGQGLRDIGQVPV